jgi:hypothetical protein
VGGEEEMGMEARVGKGGRGEDGGGWRVVHEALDLVHGGLRRRRVELDCVAVDWRRRRRGLAKAAGTGEGGGDRRRRRGRAKAAGTGGGGDWRRRRGPAAAGTGEGGGLDVRVRGRRGPTGGDSVSISCERWGTTLHKRNFTRGFT